VAGGVVARSQRAVAAPRGPGRLLRTRRRRRWPPPLCSGHVTACRRTLAARSSELRPGDSSTGSAPSKPGPLERRRWGRQPADAFVSPPADHPSRDQDDGLQLLLLCCHPSLTRPSQVALTLRSVSGLTTAEIAAAFLVPERTMAQRLSRARGTSLLLERASGCRARTRCRSG
jgi:DNA-directed RNA polymerase specialized sigma24 family protein